MKKIPHPKEFVDLIAKPTDQVVIEIQKEVGFKRVKLYIHVNDITVFRMCKLLGEQVELCIEEGLAI